MNDDSQDLVDEISTSTKMSNDAVQPVDEISTSKEMDEWVVEIRARLENPGNISHATRPSMDSNIEEDPSIFGNWQRWDDFGASFIPETQKWIYVACMTHYFGLNVRSYLEYMQEKVDRAWSYYRGVDDQFRTAENCKRFIEHLLVNSCFLIFSMILLTEENKLEDRWSEIINESIPKGLTRKDIQTILDFISLDLNRKYGYMLTMNYQIPWFVVEVVYTELSNLSKLFVTPIHKIAISCFHHSLPPRVHPSKVDGGTVPEGGFKHLLHIFHWSRTPDGKYLVDPLRPDYKIVGQFHIPSATELKLSQIVFVKDEGGSIDAFYSDNRRLMQLTPLHLFQHSTKLYESLLRFEREYGYCGFPFTAYVACMACLLKTEADVRVLRENGVIPSTMFDDKDVLRCVQELKTFIPDNLKIANELAILEKKMMAHYQRSAYRVYGEFKNRYCSKPWIAISVIAAILLFVLTFIQTVLSFIQTKYSVLSYKKQ